jgi:hypothetical protein
MKTPIALLACLLAALPVATLAGPPQHYSGGGGEHGNVRSSSGSTRSSYTQRTQPRQSYNNAPRQSYNNAPRQSYNNAPRQSYNAAPRQRYNAAPRANYNNAPRTNYNYTQRDNYTTRENYSNRRVAVSAYEGRNYASRWSGWEPRVGFWGGGFWGSLSIGLAPSAYIVQNDSPGYDLLAQYNLQQTDCEQPNLVQIQGPDGSEVCAYPNDQVGPGAYQVDPSTMTLISE